MTCYWEDFIGRGELVERLKIHSPLEKDKKRWMREEKQMDVRMRYGVDMPSWKTRNRILEDFPRVTGRPLNYYNSEDELMSFWRQNKEAYDFKEVEDAWEMVFSHMHIHRLCE
jgi:hypothetical protein